MQGLSAPLHAGSKAKCFREALEEIISRTPGPGDRGNFNPALLLSRLGSHISYNLTGHISQPVNDPGRPLSALSWPKQAPCDVMRNG